MTRFIVALLTCIVAHSAVAQTAGTALWEFATQGEIYSSPAVADDGTIYFGSRDGSLYALTPAGKQKWTFPAGGLVDAAPSIAGDGTVYVGSGSGNLYALTTDGKVKWQFPTGSSISNPVAVASDGTVYVNAKSGIMYAVNFNGSKKWEIATGKEMPAPTVAQDGTIYVGFDDSKDRFLYALNPDGSRKWRVAMTPPTSSCSLDSEGNVYVAATKFYGLRPDGTQKFTAISFLGNVSTTPTIGEGNILYLPLTTAVGVGRLRALFPSGDQKWQLDLALKRSPTAPAIGSDGNLYFGTADEFDAKGTVVALDPNGTKLWEMRVGTRADQIYAAPTLSRSGVLYVGSVDKKLHAIKASSGPATSAWPSVRHDERNSGSATPPPSDNIVLGVNMYAGVQINGKVGNTYQVEYSDNVPGAWKTLGRVTLERTPHLFFDIESTNSNKRFYRAVMVP